MVAHRSGSRKCVIDREAAVLEGGGLAEVEATAEAAQRWEDNRGNSHVWREVVQLTRPAHRWAGPPGGVMGGAT